MPAGIAILVAWPDTRTTFFVPRAASSALILTATAIFAPRSGICVRCCFCLTGSTASGNREATEGLALTCLLQRLAELPTPQREPSKHALICHNLLVRKG